MTVCEVPTCDRPAHAHGRCRAHYKRKVFPDSVPIYGGYSGYSPDLPWVCECDDSQPDTVGECATCHRLCLSHSWHEGRPS